MTLSLITLNRGRDQHLKRLIEGTARGSRSPDEIIVVAMGGDAFNKPSAEVVIVRIKESGLPLARSRNLGRQRARGDILVFLDVDCIPSHDLLANFETAAIRHDALICSEVFYLTQPVTDDCSEASLYARGIPHPARHFPGPGNIIASHSSLFWSLAFAVRAETYDQIGGFDEGFDGYGGEDTDLAYRAAAAGVPTLFVGDGCAFHQKHPSYDPPLTHCADIVRNANRFRARHGLWPMEGWLEVFRKMGIVAFEGSSLRLVRLPSADEIDAHRVPSDRPF